MNPRGRWGSEFRIEPELEGRSYGPGPGRSKPGQEYGSYHPGYEYPPYQRERRKPLDESRARRMIESYLDHGENPNLKLGNLREQDMVFTGEIVTKKEGTIVEKVIIDKETGQMRFGY
jgi:hypothetical protein